MKQAKELYNILKVITATNPDIIPAIVKTVNADNTIDADYEGLTFPGCLLQSVSGGADGNIIKPSVDSVVLLKKINEQFDFVVFMYSSIDEYSNTIGNKIYKLNASGHLISGGNDTLKQALTLIVEAVQNIVVIYGNNPDYTKLTDALNKINNILQ